MGFIARVKKLTSYIYSPTAPASEDAIRLQIDDASQEVYDNVQSALTSTTDGDSGMDIIGMTPIIGLAAVTPQKTLEEMDSKINTGNEALTTHKTSTDHDGRYYTEAEVNSLLLANQQGDHLGSWQGILSPAYSEPGIAGVVESHTEQLTKTPLIEDQLENQVVFGLRPTINASLISNVLNGLAYLDGVKMVVPAVLSKTFTANKDTYIDLKPDKTYVYQEVEIGEAEPSVGVGNIRTSKVRTSATEIIDVTPMDQNTFYGRGAGASNTSGWKNTFYGINAGLTNTTGNFNSFVGYFAGHLNTTGTHNTFIGYGSGRGNTTGQFNTFLGFQSGHLNETGTQNIAIGYNSLEANLSGDWNIAIGYESGFKTTSNFNVFIGNSAGKNNTTGSNNVFLGTQAGNTNTTSSNNIYIGYQSGIIATGTWNTAVGTSSLFANTSGYLNTAIGLNAGAKVTTGNSNTFIGADAGNVASQSGLVSNSTAIGYNAYTTINNTIQLGNSNITNVFTHGDYETLDIGNGYICKSPNGSRYRITVSDAGAIVVTGV